MPELTERIADSHTTGPLTAQHASLQSVHTITYVLLLHGTFGVGIFLQKIWQHLFPAKFVQWTENNSRMQCPDDTTISRLAFRMRVRLPLYSELS